jgi:hypothetical protein
MGCVAPTIEHFNFVAPSEIFCEVNINEFNENLVDQKI